MKNLFYYETIVGTIGIAEENGFLTDLFFGEENAPENSVQKESPLLKEAVRQLKEYFTGSRKNFDLPLAPQGTDFQKRDWKALQEIPYGATVSYLDIAQKIGCPKGARAVGLANNRNPISIIIPCHRVIGKNGKLVGYGGGVDKKIKLLELEGAAFKK
ncbi:methylated-DNA--[protein]-cysteine S-methyltransferase [Clostridium aminobutyricum]|uniref:Methylated-DNA--protein-cysteine methyltransferase n=1 Tax=Clostridium aminobutyricum TaxID=33953 RepID=A0A939D914_CLOAM|nr:methylated-DNA--[protein]-cysteine S-methyltransferase [Clostridium aminobutyricum]MBN7773315.1 methylated-DNA--[protein]-cysteine S-methyltransferase [Clostridium aminobutyricum]